MQKPDFEAKMAKMQNEQLVEIAFSSDKEGFDPEAIAAAKAEIEKRNLPIEEFSRLEEQAVQQSEVQSNIPYEPLPRSRWILIAIFSPISLIFLLVFVYLNYSSRGYKQKATDSLKATALGYACYIALGMLLFVVGDFVG